MLLGVNIDHIATIRNARGGIEPSVLQAAKIALDCGAYSITAHLREDRRHIKDEDIFDIKNKLKCKLNMEMAATTEMQEIALKILPYACCIVPENRNEITTEGGLEVANDFEKISDFVKPLLSANIKVSLFIDPEIKQIDAAIRTGVKFIELHTGAYSNAFSTQNEEIEFSRLKNAAQYALKNGLNVNAGHGLNYINVHRMHEIEGLNELNIGHSIISRAIFTGLDKAIFEMLNLVNKN